MKSTTISPFLKRSMLALAIISALTASLFAGPIIIDGTDANDHGSSNGAANLSGWLYMQRALESLASQCNGCAKVVRVLGATAAGTGHEPAFRHFYFNGDIEKVFVTRAGVVAANIVAGERQPVDARHQCDEVAEEHAGFGT